MTAFWGRSQNAEILRLVPALIGFSLLPTMISAWRPEFPQGLDRVLGRLGLHVPHRVLGDQGHIDQDVIVGRQFSPHLADRFEERHALDVAHGAPDFDEADVRCRPFRELLFCRLTDAGLDLVGDMGDDLHGLTQEVAAALLIDDRAVYLPGGDIVGGGDSMSRKRS